MTIGPDFEAASLATQRCATLLCDAHYFAERVPHEEQALDCVFTLLSELGCWVNRYWDTIRAARPELYLHSTKVRHHGLLGQRWYPNMHELVMEVGFLAYERIIRLPGLADTSLRPEDRRDVLSRTVQQLDNFIINRSQADVCIEEERAKVLNAQRQAEAGPIEWSRFIAPAKWRTMMNGISNTTFQNMRKPIKGKPRELISRNEGNKLVSIRMDCLVGRLSATDLEFVREKNPAGK